MSKKNKSSITNTVDRKGGLNPDVVDVTIVPGDDVTVDITATVPKRDTKFPLDVVFLADLSGSYRDDLPVLRDLVPKIVSSVRDIQPNSQFGLASYIDKPKSPFGARRDFVYKTEEAITKSRTDFQKAMDGLKIGSGEDGPESQLEALMQVALREKEVGYRKNSRKVVVLSTDADYHQAGDGKRGGITTPNNGDDVLDGSPAGTGEDYPSIAQVRDALQEAGVVPIFAVTDNQVKTYERLVDQLGFGTVERLSRDSSNLVKVVTDGLEDILDDLTMVPQSDDFGYVKNIKPATYENVRPGQSRTFEVTLGTKDAKAGKDRLSLEVLGYGETVVNVTPPRSNSAPSAKNDRVVFVVPKPFQTIQPERLLENDKDKDGDKLTITKVGKATNGKVELTKSGEIIFTPRGDHSKFARGSFEYTISDGKGGTDTAKATVRRVGDESRSARSAGTAKADALTGGEEGQRFVYDELSDGGTIANFEVGNDVIVLTDVLDSVGYEGTNAIADEYVRVVSRGANAMVQIDPDGPEGPGGFEPFVFVKGVTEDALDHASNFAF